MKNIKIIFITVTLIILFFLALGTYVNTYNYGNKMDNLIKSQYQNMENVLAQYSQKIQEMVQVPTIYKDDLREIIRTSMQGRYGEEGSRAVIQFIQENNPAFDSNLYKIIQQNIEAGRKDFEFENKKLIDILREYNTALGSFYIGKLLKIAGYPKINLDEFKPISNSYAKDTFKKGYEETPIKLR